MKRFLSILLALSCLCVFSTTEVYGAARGETYLAALSSAADVWDGSVADSIPVSGKVYTVSTCAQLAKLARMVNEGDKLKGYTVQLAADLDLNYIPWTPIGDTRDTPFYGVFDGNGYTISHLQVGTEASPHTADGAGLFGQLFSSSSAVKNLTITNSQVYGTNMVGLIAGKSYGSALTNCQASGIVSGASYVGMICGYNSGSAVTMCSGTGNVRCDQYSGGGILGCASKVTVQSCESTASISGGSKLGGIIGDATNSTVSDCYSRSPLSGVESIGGIAGCAVNGSISSCYWSGSMTADRSYGGVVGFYDPSNEPVLSSCYYNSAACPYPANESDSAVSGVTGVTADALQAQSTFSDWDFSEVWHISSDSNHGYPILSWQSFTVLEPADAVGDAWSDDPGDVEDDTSGTISGNASGTISGNVSDDASGTISGNVSDDTSSTISDNVSDDILSTISGDISGNIASGFAGGSGTKEDPYLVQNEANLTYLARMTNGGVSFSGKYIEQTSDITLTAQSWTPIGLTQATPFSGTYTGNGHTIRGLRITDEAVQTQGLFGYIDGSILQMLNLDDAALQNGTEVGAFAGHVTNGSLPDCNALSNVTIRTSSGSYVGGVAGVVSGGSVSMCGSAATVHVTSSGAYVGGVVGSVQGIQIQVFACYHSGEVAGTFSSNYVGGIVGCADSAAISNCFNTGAVAGSGSTGGIVGELPSGSSVSCCYNTGEISNRSYPSGGIVGLAADGSAIASSYNCGVVTANSIDLARGIAGFSGGDVTDCYYLSTSTADANATSRTPVEMVNSSSMSGLGSSPIWTYVSGENNGYPVLSVFYPALTTSASSLVFDKYESSDEHHDISVQFSGYGCVLTDLCGVSQKMYEISVNNGDSTNVGTISISKEYLSTLPVGQHELTARFGANRFVSFTITVKDSTANQYQFAVTNTVLSADSAAVTFQLSSPSSTLARFLVGVYRDGQMVAVKTAQLTLDGGNQITLTLPYSSSYTYKAFLTDAATYAPLWNATEFLVP